MAWKPVARCAGLEQGDVRAVDCSGAHLALYRLEDGIVATWISGVGFSAAVVAQRANADGSLGDPPLATDLNGDGAVNAADFDGSGVVDAADLAMLLGAWS